MRVIVSAILRDFENRILLAKRVEDGKYTTPGGKVETDENLFEALYRETKEESGIEIGSRRYIQYIECRNKLIMAYEITTWRGEAQHKEPHKHGPWAFIPVARVKDELTEGLAILHKLGVI